MNLIFDGHNDCVQRLQEYRPGGVDFLVRSAGGHLDLSRAVDGGLKGGLFAMTAHPERHPGRPDGYGDRLRKIAFDNWMRVFRLTWRQ